MKKLLLEFFRNSIRLLKSFFLAKASFRIILFFLGLLFLSIPAHAAILIGRDPNWFPLDLREKTTNVNFFINALIEKMNTETQNPLSVINIGSTNLMQGLLDEKYAAILSTISTSIALRNQFDFSDPILLLGPVLIVPISKNAESLSDLCGKLIGISAYDNSTTIIQQYPSILMKEYDNMAMALEDLSLGSLDAVVMEALEAQGIVANLYANKLRITPAVLSTQGIRLVTLKGKNSDLIYFFNNQITQLIKNSFYENLLHYSLIK